MSAPWYKPGKIILDAKLPDLYYFRSDFYQIKNDGTQNSTPTTDTNEQPQELKPSEEVPTSENEHDNNLTPTNSSPSSDP